MSRALHVLQMKKENVFKFLAGGAHLGGTNCCLWKSCWGRAISSRMTGQQAVLKFVAATGNHSYCWLLLSWIFTNQIQTAFCKLQILVVTDPRAVWFNLPNVAVDRADSVPCGCGRAARGQGHSLHGSAIVDAGLGRSAPAWPHLWSAPAKGHTCSTSTETLKRWHRRSKLQLQKLWPRRNFRVSRLFQLLNLWPLNQKQQAALQPQASSAVFRDSLLRRSQPTSQDHTAASWQGHLKLFFHRFSNRKCK